MNNQDATVNEQIEFIKACNTSKRLMNTLLCQCYCDNIYINNKIQNKINIEIKKIEKELTDNLIIHIHEAIDKIDELICETI